MRKLKIIIFPLQTSDVYRAVQTHQSDFIDDPFPSPYHMHVVWSSFGSVCTEGTPSPTGSLGGSCEIVSYGSTNSNTLVDFTVITLDFAPKNSGLCITNTDQPFSLASTDLWTRLSLPRDYGDISFSILPHITGFDGLVIDPRNATPGETYTVTASLPFWNGTAIAVMNIKILPVIQLGGTATICENQGSY